MRIGISRAPSSPGGLTAGIEIRSETWDCATDSEVVLYRVVDGPHQWPTGPVFSAIWEIARFLDEHWPFKPLMLSARSSFFRQDDRVSVPFEARSCQASRARQGPRSRARMRDTK